MADYPRHHLDFFVFAMNVEQSGNTFNDYNGPINFVLLQLVVARARLLTSTPTSTLPLPPLRLANPTRTLPIFFPSPLPIVFNSSLSALSPFVCLSYIFLYICLRVVLSV